ncbi:Uncharacterized protein TCM_014891 [Theobroma cacao]|uniref:F-box domain-containing protein n=1 Tax=Theobroma cacao TaxID=3641 RepID=A0A061FZZ3_THECC|nr:Uncharacterized protein TCM_014891 [Theobroma cacao]
MGKQRSKQLKKTKGVNKTSFDELADDLKEDVFRRLDIKDRGKFKCVSKEWRRLITAACSPICSGFLYKNANMNRPLAEVKHLSYQPWSGDPLSGKLRFHASFAFEESLPFKLSSGLQESCNGLLLLCHCHKSEVGSIVKESEVGKYRGRLRMYSYYVINPLTRQYFVICKPKPNSALYNYAALAYHPAESSHFKIEAREPWVVQEIEIPGTAKINEAACIGLSNDHIKFAISDGSSLKIWELNHQFVDSRDYNRWSLKFSCRSQDINRSFKYPTPLTFHPNLDAIVLCLVDYGKFASFGCLHYSEEMAKAMPCLMQLRWRNNHKFVFPLFQCEAPFAGDTAK